MCEHYPDPLHPRSSVPCERIVMYVMYLCRDVRIISRDNPEFFLENLFRTYFIVSKQVASPEIFNYRIKKSTVCVRIIRQRTLKQYAL